ncbi:MAG: hypothetical protein H6724_08670 [Sandaracinus sp.]|nr:hypothetical protein [Sandaracinus sp.]
MTRLAVFVALVLLGVAAAGAQPSTRTTTPRTTRVVLFRSPGVAPDASDATEALLRATPGFSVSVFGPADVQRGRLDGMDIVVFTGGRGSIQGRYLGERGRAQVREFVRVGGGYVGICAGAYLALQGEPEFHKIAFVAGRHATGDAWRRGVATTWVEPLDGSPRAPLHYANGPILAPEAVEGLDAFVPLAVFRADVYSERHGTRAGEMPGTPAVVAARYGRGRLVLFSPNPVLEGPDEPAQPQLFLSALRFVRDPAPLPRDLGWRHVFGE